MRKPTKPSRPAKPQRAKFFRANARYKKEIPLHNHTGYKSHLPLATVLEAAKKLSPEGIAAAEVRAPYGSGWNKDWSIKIDADRHEEEIEKLFAVAEADYDVAWARYQKSLEAYREDLAAWNNHEMNKLTDRYEKEKAKLEREMK